jgi:hypothetical protein
MVKVQALNCTIYEMASTNLDHDCGEYHIKMEAKGKYTLELFRDGTQEAGTLTQEAFFWHPNDITIGSQKFPLTWKGNSTEPFKPIIPRLPYEPINVFLFDIKGADEKGTDISTPTPGKIVVHISKGGEPVVEVSFKVRWERQ